MTTSRTSSRPTCGPRRAVGRVRGVRRGGDRARTASSSSIPTTWSIPASPMRSTDPKVQRLHRGPARPGRRRHPVRPARDRRRGAQVRAAPTARSGSPSRRRPRPARPGRPSPAPRRPAAGGDVFGSTRSRSRSSNPYTFRATAVAQRDRAARGDRARSRSGWRCSSPRRWPAGSRRPLRQLTEASSALAEGDLGRRVPARPGPGRLVRAERAGDPVQRHGRPARGERRDHPARPRPEPRLPRRRLARAADAARGPADVQRAAHGAGRRRPGGPRRVPRVERASRSSGWTGWPRTCSSCPSSTPGWSCSTCGRTTSGRRSRSAVEQAARRPREARRHARAPAADRAGPDPPRPAADRPGGDATSSATRSSSRRAAARSTVELGADAGRARGSRSTDTGVGIDAGRAAAHLRAVLSRLARQRGARQRQRPRAGDRPLDRRHARRHGRGREPRRGRARGSSSTLPRDPRLVERRAGRGTRRQVRVGRRRDAAAETLGRNVTETSPTDRPQVNPEPAP